MKTVLSPGLKKMDEFSATTPEQKQVLYDFVSGKAVKMNELPNYADMIRSAKAAL